jgi:hypothetical protein
VNTSGGFAHLDPRIVEPAIAKLAEAGIAAQASWRTASGTIMSTKSGIGQAPDVLASSFRLTYDTKADQAYAFADLLPGKYAELSAVAKAAVQDYFKGDYNASMQFPG